MLDQVHRLLVVVYVLRFYKSEGELGVCVHVCNVMRLHDGLLHEGKGKGHPRTGHEGPDREQRYCSTLSLTSALDLCVWVVKATPRPLFTPPGKTRYPLYMRLGGPQDLVWTGVENLARTGI